MIEIIEVDLKIPSHANATVSLMDQYALDLMGGGKGLSNYAKANLPAELLKRKEAHVIMAFVNLQPVGLLVCLEGFSTFACKPLLNIHDVIVTSSHRGKGISKLLMQKAEKIARDLGCCKLTLEVLEENYIAQSAYKSFGFSGYELNPLMGKALFWEKKLEAENNSENLDN
jgi:ribosomal protein S18 acetylase RimI-like enzyme